MAMNEGTTLSNTVNDSPVLMVKSLRASDFQGICICLFLASAISDQIYWLDSLLLRLCIDIWLELTQWLPPLCSSTKSYSSWCVPGVSLSTTSNSMVAINPDIPEAIALRNWSVLC
jgi:hypothetical protein